VVAGVDRQDAIDRRRRKVGVARGGVHRVDGATVPLCRQVVHVPEHRRLDVVGVAVRRVEAEVVVIALPLPALVAERVLHHGRADREEEHCRRTCRPDPEGTRVGHRDTLRWGTKLEGEETSPVAASADRRGPLQRRRFRNSYELAFP